MVKYCIVIVTNTCCLLIDIVLILIKGCKSLQEDNVMLKSFFNYFPHIKQHLHYNELAQRTASVWRYLAFIDIDVR